MAVLRVKTGNEKGKIYEIADETLTIGRDRGGAIQVLDQGASRQHAEVFNIGELFFIRDLESRNGTFVNTEKIDEVVLRFGDQIQIGNTVLVFEDRQARFKDSENIIVDDGGQPPSADPTQTLQLTRAGNPVGAALKDSSESAESRRLAALLAISHIVGSETNLSKILNLAANHLGQVVDADNVFIFQVRASDSAEENGASQSYKLIGRYDRDDSTQGEGVSRTIIRDCLDQGRAVLTSDAGLDARYNAMASVVMQKIRSVICVPITGIGKNLGVVYISNSQKPEAFQSEELELASAVAVQLGTTMQLLRQIRASEKIFRNSIRTLVAAIEMRDPYHKGRAERLAKCCLSMAKQLNWNTHDCRNAWLAGMLYDIGSIPLSDRDREGTFTLDTRKNHYASQLLQEMPGIEEILPAIVQQKERWNGAGSPEGIKGDEIHPLAQILGLAFEFDQIKHPDDSTAPPPNDKEALMEIMKTSGKSFNEEIVKALITAFRSGELSEGDDDFFDVKA